MQYIENMDVDKDEIYYIYLYIFICIAFKLLSFFFFVVFLYKAWALRSLDRVSDNEFDEYVKDGDGEAKS